MKKVLSSLIDLFWQIHPKNITKHREFGHSLWTVSGQLLVSLATFLFTYALANFVGEDDVGSFRFILALYSSATVFALIGVSTALSRSVAAGMTGSIAVALKTKLGYGFFASLFFIGCAIYYYGFTDKDYLWIPLVLAGLCLPLNETLALYGPYLTGASRFKESSLYLAIERFLTSFITAIVAFGFPSLLWIVVAYFLSHIFIRYFLFIRSIKVVTPNEEVDVKMVSYAKHLTLMSLLGSVTAQLDKYILFIFFGPAALASFWVAAIIPQEIGRFLGAVMGTFFPRMVRGNKENTVILVKKIFLLITVLVVIATSAYALFVEYIFVFMFPLYIEYTQISVWLMLAFSLIPHQLVWSIFTAKQNVKALYLYGIAEPALTVLVYLVFIPPFGVWGLVYATLMRTVVMNLSALYILYRNKI